MEAWMLSEIERLTKTHGMVPPPWIAFPNVHPYSICWRMGGGESLIMLWGPWWREQRLSEDGRIGYFRKWPPPPCWLSWMIDAIWNSEGEEEFDEEPYFDRVERLGFGSREKQQYPKTKIF